MENDNDIVVSTRIRLARNLKNYPFTHKLSSQGMKEIESLVKDAMLKSNSSIQDEFCYIEMSKISDIQALSLAERHLISPEFSANREGRGLLLMKDESVSIMINEEDHIRLQVIKDGFNLDLAYNIADNIDTLLDEQLSFAFDERLGYLTKCATNLGTGMRASVMMHLPMMQNNKLMGDMASMYSKRGITIRGTYGEGSDAVGGLYQLSNQITLGLSEQESISNIKDAASALIAGERRLREVFTESPQFLDMLSRSLGILKYSKMLSKSEAMKFLSFVRLGMSIGVVNDVSVDTLNSLINDIQPATIMNRYGPSLTDEQQEQKRSDIVKEKLSEKV